MSTDDNDKEHEMHKLDEETWEKFSTEVLEMAAQQALEIDDMDTFSEIVAEIWRREDEEA